MDSPLLRLTLWFLAGILLGRGFLFFPWMILALSLSLAGAGLIIARVQRSGYASAVLAVLGTVVGALISVLSGGHLPESHYANAVILDGGRRELSGTITSSLERDPGRTAFVLAVDQIDGRRVSGALRTSVHEELSGIGYGDHLTLSGRLHPPRGFRNPGGFDYPAHLARHGMHAVLQVKGSEAVRVDRRGRGLLRSLQDIRERIRQSFLRSLSGESSAVLQAMVLGEDGMLTDDLRDRFMASGVTHILSISGSHLGLVAILCFWVTKNLLFLLPQRHYHHLTLHADPVKIAAAVAVVPVTFYAFLAGAQVATLRALIMILAGLAALLLDREKDLPSALSIAALVILLPDPQALFDISFQLSYLSVLSIIFVVDTARAVALPSTSRGHRWLRALLVLLAISVAAGLITGPFVAYYFNQVSFAGVLANMIVVPFAGAVVVPLGLLSGFLSLFRDGLPFASPNQLAGESFIALVDLFTHIPCAGVNLPSPDPLFMGGFVGLVAGGGLAIRTRLFARYRPLESSRSVPRSVRVGIALSLLLLAAALVLPFLRGSKSRVTFLDVGQGDCALVETSGGARILIDGGGTRENRFDTGRRVVAPLLWDRGIRSLDLVVLSHPHPDHMNGLHSIVKLFSVKALWVSGLDGGHEGLGELRRLLSDRAIPFRLVMAGATATFGDVVVEVIHPREGFNPGTTKNYAAENNRSLVLRMTVNGRTMLFPGDIHQEGEQALLANVPGLTADIVKAPHHGSRSSSSEAFVTAVRPRIAVISVGAGNPYRQPSEDILGRYEQHGARVYRTDRDGAVMVDISDTDLTVTPWSSLVLERIRLNDVRSWGALERRNWKRVWVRRWET